MATLYLRHGKSAWKPYHTALSLITKNVFNQCDAIVSNSIQR